MKRALALLTLSAAFLAGCAVDPMTRRYPAPAPAPADPYGTRTPPPDRRAPVERAPTRIDLPNGEVIPIMRGTRLLPSCAVFGISEDAHKEARCIALPARYADGRGGGQAQDTYAGYLRSAGYASAGNGNAMLRYSDARGCRQHVVLSTLPAEATQSDDWGGVDDYVLFMEFTPLTCPQ